MKTLKILHLEDNKIDAEYVQSLLESQDLSADIDLVDNKHDFLHQLQEKQYDLILADFKLPSFDGISALLLAAKYAARIPFIFVSGSMGEDLAVDALKHGATDYVLKHHISRLVPAVERAIRENDERIKRKKAEEMQKRMVAILERTSDLVGMFSMDGKTDFLNAHGRQILGIPIDEDLTNTHWSTFLTKESAEAMEASYSVAAKEGVWTGETVGLSRSGVEIPGSQVLIAHFDDDGKISFFSTVIRDITAMKEVENSLRTAKERAEESERLKDYFIATMSHEIRTPLNVIMGYSSFVRSNLEGKADEEMIECLSSIDRGGKRLMRSVENILNISSLRVGTFIINKELVDLNNELQSLSDDFLSFANEKGITLTLEAGEGESLVSVDTYSLRGALSNVMDNAIKFTKKGGVHMRVYKDDRFVCMECKDTGIGISDEYKKNLFSLFSQEEQGYTRSFDGLGIGLALTQRYTELNNGVLEIESAKGRGTTVTLKFPIAGMYS
jgi:PAS domain S-box-containing protein